MFSISLLCLSGQIRLRQSISGFEDCKSNLKSVAVLALDGLKFYEKYRR
jgi:hypothetical protein